MKLLRAAIAVALAVGALPTIAPHVAVAEPRRAAVLRGKTTFSFSVPGSIRFFVPKRIDLRNDFDFDVRGSGRAYGFAFWRANGKSGWAPGVEYVKLGMCTKRGCRAKGAGGFAFLTGRKLPAGEYEMYVVADGEPVEVSFAVEGLGGKAAYRPTRIDAEFRTLDPTIDASQGAQTYSAGDFTTLRESDWSFFGMWALGRNDLATAFGSCAHSDGDIPNPPTPAAFLPGCPLGDGFESVNEGPNGGSVLTLSDHGGPEGIGGWFAAGNTHARYGAVAFWMDT